MPCVLPPSVADWSWPQKSPTPEQQQSDYEKKKANFITRTFWTVVMIGGFFAALFMGHVYILVIITAVQIVSFKEVIAIANVPSRARDLQSTKSLNWYWLATTMYFLYGESIVYYLKHIVLVDKVLLPLATHHRFISFILYVFGAYHACLALSGPGLWKLLADTGSLQALCSSSAHSRRAISSSSSRSSPGLTWPSSSSSSKRTLL